MLTTVGEADQMDDKGKTVAKLVTKERPEELTLDAPADFVLLDDAKLLASIFPSLKSIGFVLLQTPSAAELTTPLDAQVISQKSFDGKTLSLYKKVSVSEKTLPQFCIN